MRRFLKGKRNGVVSFVAGAIALVCISAPAQSAVTTYSDLATWQAATTADVNRDFNNYPGTQSFLGTFTNQGVTFSATNNYLYSQGPVSCGSACQWGPNLGTGNYLLGPWWPGSLSATLSDPATAVGVYLALDGAIDGTFPPTVSVTVNFASGPAQAFTVTLAGQDQVKFFGLTDGGDPITSLTMSPSNLYPQYYCDPNVCYNGLSGPNLLVDNFETGASLAAPAPELSTWAMMLLGFAGVGFMGYRCKKRPVLMAV